MLLKFRILNSSQGLKAIDYKMHLEGKEYGKKILEKGKVSSIYFSANRFMTQLDDIFSFFVLFRSSLGLSSSSFR